MKYTIYSEEVWKRILDDYPDFKVIAIELGLADEPQRAQKLKEDYFKHMGSSKFSKLEQEFCNRLASIQFVENDMFRLIISRGKEAMDVGDTEDAVSSFDLILMDFNITFEAFLREIKRRKAKDINELKFAEIFPIFLDTIKVKLDYKIPYTKLFIRKLLKLTPDVFKDEKIFEIKEYFAKEDSLMLMEIQEELV